MKTNTKPRPKPDRATAEAEKALKPLIKFAQAHKGTIEKVRARLEALTGERQHRQLVEAWLHPDPAKRAMPRMGTGLLLLKVWDEINRADLAKRGIQLRKAFPMFDACNANATSGQAVPADPITR